MIAGHVDAGADLETWYESKTRALLEKYAVNGPRVHYHIGPAVLSDEPRRAMWDAQERELDEAFARWRNVLSLSGRALDVGCGLGGSMLWLEEKGWFERIEGLTIAASHPEVISRLAGHTMQVHVGDANDWTGGSFDTIYSVQASCLFRRERWFPRVARMLNPGGCFLIDDYLLGDPALKLGFDAAYAGNIGPREEYLALAKQNDLQLVDEMDRTELSSDYWELCARYSEKGNAEGWHQSPAFHRSMRQAQRERRYEHRLFAFVRR